MTLQGDLHGDDTTIEGIRETVAERIGKFARPKRIIWSEDLPKTRSGKIMRRLLRDIAEGRALGDVTTLRDPAVMGQLEGARCKELQAEEDVGGANRPTVSHAPRIETGSTQITPCGAREPTRRSPGG